MQPNAIIFHGTGADPQTAWYPWLGGRLAERGYAVSIPHYPGMNIEPVATLLPKVLASHVAGYCTQPNTEDEPVLQNRYDWDTIKAHTRDMYFINSVQDPYGCDAAQGRAMFDRLGGTQIIRNDGHFGDYGQPFETFELLDRLIP